MTLMPRRDYYAEALARYNSYGDFPNGCNTWKEFAASMQRDEEIYFALRLMEQPKERVLHLGFAGNRSTFDPITFGILTRRTNGKFGRLCFRDNSEREKRKEKGRFVLMDGLDKGALGVAPETEEDVRAFLSPNFDGLKSVCRISALFLKKEEVEEQLGNWLVRWIRGEENLSKERASELQELRVLMRQFLPPGALSAVSASIRESLQELDQKLLAYAGRLQERITSHKSSIKELQTEIESIK